MMNPAATTIAAPMIHLSYPAPLFCSPESSFLLLFYDKMLYPYPCELPFIVCDFASSFFDKSSGFLLETPSFSAWITSSSSPD